jgi:hypothetical protein
MFPLLKEKIADSLHISVEVWQENDLNGPKSEQGINREVSGIQVP